MAKAKPLNAYQQKVVARIIQRQAEGRGIDYGAIKSDEPCLLGKIRHHFRSFKKAIIAAGFDYKEIRRAAYAKKTRERHEKWRPEILSAIRIRYRRGEPLNTAAIKQKKNKGGDLRLYKRAVLVFGSWPKAVDLALASLGKSYDDVGHFRRTDWTRKMVAEAIKSLNKQGVNLSYSNMKREASRYRLFKAGIERYGSWHKAVKAQKINYDAHVRRWLMSHRKDGKVELTKQGLFDLIEERWRSGSPLNPRCQAVGGAISAATRLFPPRRGVWRRVIEMASAERGLGIDYEQHVLKNIPNKWNQERIGKGIRELYEAGKPLHVSYVRKKHVQLWGAAQYHYRNEGGYPAAVRAEGIDYDKVAAVSRVEAVLQRRSRQRNPKYFARAMLDKEADIGKPLKATHLQHSSLEKWTAFHGGVKKAREMMTEARNALGDNERLALAARTGNEAVINKLLQANMGYIKQQSVHYTARGLEFVDALQLAKLGFVIAIKKWRAVRGGNLLTLAYHEIRHTIQREPGGLYAGVERIRVPVHAQAAVAKLHNLEVRHIAQRGWRFSQEAREERLGDTMAFDNAMSVRSVKSLSQPLRVGADGALDDVLVGEKGEGQFTGVVQEQMRAALDMLGQKNPRFAEILRRRYGIERKRDETLEEIGKDFQVTRERIRQIEEKAKKKLRLMLESLARRRKDKG